MLVLDILILTTHLTCKWVASVSLTSQGDRAQNDLLSFISGMFSRLLVVCSNVNTSNYVFIFIILGGQIPEITFRHDTGF